LGDSAGAPKKNTAPQGVFQGHMDGLWLSMRYLLSNLQTSPLSLQQCCVIGIIQAVQLRAFPARAPTLQEHPTDMSHRKVWQPEPWLSSGCLQQKFGGTATQFSLLCVLKSKEHFGDWTFMQP